MPKYEQSDMIYDSEAVLRASGAITSSGNGTGKKIGYHNVVKVVVRVTAVSGTSPTLDIAFEESDDDSTYYDIAGGVMDQITAVGDYVILLRTTRPYLRDVVTVGGTSPSFTTEIFLTTAP